MSSLLPADPIFHWRLIYGQDRQCSVAKSGDRRCRTISQTVTIVLGRGFNGTDDVGDTSAHSTGIGRLDQLRPGESRDQSSAGTSPVDIWPSRPNR